MAHPNSNINPNFKKAPSVLYSAEECISGLKSQNHKIISHLISRCESTLRADQDFVFEVIESMTPNQDTRRIAISGSPGVGKSTFINNIGHHLSKKGHTIAILPVDPSSSISKGSILGDKTRMEDIVHTDSVYIKPMPSSLALGGVAPSSYIASYICQLAGFDYIVVETVGVGQSEIEARHQCDMFLLLLQPGGGDDLQGIKRGVMEMADLLIINKADGHLKGQADRAMDDYAHALKLMHHNTYGWKTKICKHSSIESTANPECVALMEGYFSYMMDHNHIKALRHKQQLRYFEDQYKEQLWSYVEKNIPFKKNIIDIKTDLVEDKIGPFSAVRAIKKLMS